MDKIRTLKSINNTSHTLLDLLALRHPNSRPPNSPQVQTVLSIPDPLPITGYLAGLGWKASAAEQFSKAYMQHAIRLKKEYENSMTRAVNDCLVTVPSPHSLASEVAAIQATYVAIYNRALRQWIDTSIHMWSKRILILTDRRSSIATDCDKRPSFNQNVLSILEDTFSRIQYPTRTDKQHLAQKTGMELRQIHVWFQNRRSRSRRKGQALQKCTLVLEREPTNPPLVRPVPHADKAASVDQTSSRTHLIPCPLDFDAPAHAFPAPYPPVCECDPFPQLGVNLDTRWRRHPAARGSIPGLASGSIKALIIALSKLSVKDEQSLTADALSSGANEHQTRSWLVPCYPSLVVPSRAPLPALLRTTARPLATTSSGPMHPLSLASVRPLRGTATTISAIHGSPARQPTPIKLTQSSLSCRSPRLVSMLTRNSYSPYSIPSSYTRPSRLARLSSASSLSSSTSSIFSASPSLNDDTPLSTPPNSPLHSTISFAQYSDDFPPVSKFILDTVTMLPGLSSLSNTEPGETAARLRPLE